MMRPSAAKKIVARLALVTGVGTAAIGVLHAPFARSLLAKIGGCPVGKASAEDVERARRAAVASLRGDAPAPSRTALGFTLAQATVADVDRWAHERSIACAKKREDLLVVCTGVPSAEGAVDEATFAFRPSDGRLVNVTAMTFALGPDEAAVRMRASTDALRATLGEPARAFGDAAPARFAQGGFATSTTRWRFRDLAAEVTATSFDGRVVLREHWVTIEDDS